MTAGELELRCFVPRDAEIELFQHGWKQHSKHVWVSPRGRYEIGVRDAWMAMQGIEEWV